MNGHLDVYEDVCVEIVLAEAVLHSSLEPFLSTPFSTVSGLPRGYCCLRRIENDNGLKGTVEDNLYPS